jgi:hypothetical protein
MCAHQRASSQALWHMLPRLVWLLVAVSARLEVSSDWTDTCSTRYAETTLSKFVIPLNVPRMRTPRITAPIKNKISTMPNLTQRARGKTHIVNAQSRRTVTHSRRVINYAANFLSQFNADT